MRRRIAGVILAICTAGILVALLRRAPAPIFENRPLSSWLTDLHPVFSARPFDPARAEEARRAIRQMGPNALPRLIEMIRCRDSRLRLKLVWLASKQTLIDFRFRPPANRVQFQGILGIKVLGPAAREAIPDLIPLLKSNDPSVRAVAADALGLMAADAGSAVPALLLTLEDQVDFVRHSAYAALGAFTGQAKEIVPVLEPHLQDPAPEIRSAALAALLSLSTNKVERLPQIIVQLRDESPDVRARALRYAADLGHAARPAIPIISPLLGDAKAGIRLAATNALAQITGTEESSGQKNRDNPVTLKLSLPLAGVLQLYEKISGKSVQTGNGAQEMMNRSVSINTYGAVSMEFALKLVEEEVLKQLGLVIKHLEGETVVVEKRRAQP